MTLGWSSCAKMAHSVVEYWSWKPILEAILEKYTLKISATSLLSTIVYSHCRNIVWFPFWSFLSEKKGDIVREKVLSCLAQLFSKYFAIDFLRNDTTWFRRRRFSLRNLEFMYGTDYRLTNLELTGAWPSMTSLRSVLVYQAISSASSKMFMTLLGRSQLSNPPDLPCCISKQWPFL